ncbi:MAG: transposase [Bacteroidota bacterium]
MVRRNRWEAYVAGLLRNKKSRLIHFLFHRDHLHVLVELHPTLSVADLVKDIKLASTHVFKKEG